MDLNSLLGDAVARGASDVHLKVGRPPVIRYDGALTRMDDRPSLTDADLEAALHIVTADALHRLEQFSASGDLDIAYRSGDLPRFRVNIFRQRGSISLAFRVIPTAIPSFADLHLPPGIARLAEEHRGLVLVTGATGSGKTTTLAAMVDRINRTRRQHIVTIEDPIEFLHDDHGCIVNQREVGLDTDSFNEALRRALRQDPDVILIGELRDAETAQTALQAAESGHLVLSTVMVANARIADLIRENRPEEVPDAIADGTYFQMQTFTRALIDLVLDGMIDRETAANAASNRHDFLIALEYALKEQAAGANSDAAGARTAAPGLEPLPELRIVAPAER